MIIIANNKLISVLEEYSLIEKEKWKYIYINGEKTTYKCSNFGRIKNTVKKGNGYKKKKSKLLSQIELHNGYFVVSLCNNGKAYRFYVHRLVCMCFIEIPEKYKKLGLSYNDLEVNHKKGDRKWDNSIYNLEWVTSSDNKIHAYETNLQQRGEKNSHSKYTDVQIHKVCKFIEENKLTPKEISKITGVSIAQIQDIRNFGSWNHISSKYDFSNYIPKQQKYDSTKINKMKNMLKNRVQPRLISNKTGIPIKTVYYYRSKYFK